ncbi:DUF2785 domain containing protein [Lysobacter dokdonensis DS-58]|uniref:DUF2785 domain containing protein n=1 Tax=Lysobacter dokdonensis DS-58 TaxID=1300345 RepID=A0A0A2WK26_9GAMM|nr:DUF2782 domain-containing protein [Lysobacter dokdonensis]KGQ19072.1 DUF2785 domain containing protein [Lysobacter dokdonensis DS-58]
MARNRPVRTLAAVAVLALVAGCATAPQDPNAPPPIPEGSEQATRTESNGDIVTEYRVNGSLAMVRVVPKNGPTYYVTDADGDGRLDRNSDGTRNVPVYFKLYGW